MSESADRATTSLKPPPRVGRLDSLLRVRRELAKIYGEARRGLLDTGDATRLAHVLNLIGRSLAADQLEGIEQRLQRLEESRR